MPPANSPNREPTPSIAAALRGLESPSDDVFNLAATLTTQAGDAAAAMDDARPSPHALRTTQQHDQQRLEQSRDRLREIERMRADLDHIERMQRMRSSLARLDRLHSTSASTRSPAAAATQYGDRVPSQTNNLYDWSPLPRIDTTEDRSMQALLSRLGPSPNPPMAAVGESRRHPRFAARTREHLQRYSHEREREREREREELPSSSGLRRSTADPWAPPRERYQASRSPQPPPQPHALSQSQPQSQSQSHVQSQSHSYSQSQSQHQAPAVSPMLEHTVKYLSRIRHAHTVDESLNCALEAGFLSKDYFCIQYADFLTDTFAIPPPQETSWLAPGAVLSGCQHATPSTPTSFTTSQLPPPPRPWLSTSYSTPRSLASHLTPTASAPLHPSQPLPHQDRWPVKVTIHAVDWAAMSLSATMEAYNVPSYPHQHPLSNPTPTTAQYTRTSSITTYLEGEILDFNTHTLLTESFKSNPSNDALYWRKLPPFRDMSDEDVVRALTSRRWWEALHRDWVLMRWKERCFVKSLRPGSKNPTPSWSPVPPHDNDAEYYVYDSATLARHAVSPAELHTLSFNPSPETGFEPHVLDAEHAAFDDTGCGLTISGFYYVCLRRADGRVDGLYYDPMSSPYQCLMLESRGRGGFGSWSFA